MKLFLDDIRNPKRDYGDDWIWVKTYNECIKYLKTGQVEVISLDHDLDFSFCNKTGYDVVCWIEQAVVKKEIQCPAIFCHSMNPSGRKRILQVIDKLEPYWKGNQL